MAAGAAISGKGGKLSRLDHGGGWRRLFRAASYAQGEASPPQGPPSGRREQATKRRKTERWCVAVFQNYPSGPGVFPGFFRECKAKGDHNWTRRPEKRGALWRQRRAKAPPARPQTSYFARGSGTPKT